MEEIKEEAKVEKNTSTVVAEETKIEEGAKKWFKCACDCSNKKKHIIAAIVLVVAIAIGGGVYFYKMKKADIGLEGAKKTVTDFVNNNLLQPGTTATVKSAVKDGGLYSVVITVGKQDITTYITQDGKKFFPEAMDTAPAPSAADQAKQQAAAPQQDIPKSDVPDVKLFVMSYCPFGTQMEKGILPVLDTLKSKIKYSLEFVDYSMHNNKATNDRKELDENLRQYCIEKNQPTKLNTYLACFLKKGQGTEASCMASAGANAAQVATCMKQADTQFNVTKNFDDQSTYSGGQFPIFEVNKDDNVKYGVQGSPTLVINDVTASAAGRDSSSILKTICGAFNNPPKECAAKLSTTAPASGFGDGTAAVGAPAASCGN